MDDGWIHEKQRRAVNNRMIQKITLAGMSVNIFLAGIKFVTGLLGGSQAVVADAVHSVSDLSTDVAVLLGAHFWTSPADEEHPYGHQRIETLITMAIGLALATVAIGIGYNGLMTIGEEHLRPPHWAAFAGAFASIIIKELLYRYTARVGKSAKSSAVIANAWHHRSDALSSIPAAAAAGIAVFNPAFAIVDHIGALVVGVFILYASLKIMWPPLVELSGRGANREQRAALLHLAREMPEVISVHALRTRRMGPGMYVDLHLLVKGTLSVREGHEISEEVKRRLIEQGPDVVDVVVHIEPEDEQDDER